MSIFAALDIYRDDTPRSAAMNMAIDEALLENAAIPSIRFYRWDHPALSFGYFGKFADAAEHPGRDLVRRWTGGGIVLHGEDLTYSLVVPVSDSAFGQPSTSIYESAHRAIQSALGSNATLAATAAPKVSEACFANAVRADVLMNGRKIAGAAQRRTRRGLLQQGSIQHVDLERDFETRFAGELSRERTSQRLPEAILRRGEEIAAQKYGTGEWLRRR